MTTKIRRNKQQNQDANERGIISMHDRSNTGHSDIPCGDWRIDWRRLMVRSIYGPLLFLFKSGTSSAQEHAEGATVLLAIGVSHGITYLRHSNVSILVAIYLTHSGFVWAHSVVGLLVATTAGFLLGVLRPRYSFPARESIVMVTLLIPSIVSMVALYSMIVDFPVLHINLINTLWSVWLPMGVSSFNVLLMTNAFKGIPRDLIEAARLDGASNLRIFRSIVLPMQKPILGVVSLLQMVHAYKDFLWPMLTLRDSSMQPIAVALPKLEGVAAFPTYMAALFMALLIPVLLFLVFHKQFLSSAGSQGAIKE